METNPEPRGTPTPNQPGSVIRTFLIADIRGYSRYSEARGDEAAARLAERFVSIAKERPPTR
jgi:class 3 adenylate cyclase